MAQEQQQAQGLYLGIKYLYFQSNLFCITLVTEPVDQIGAFLCPEKVKMSL